MKEFVNKIQIAPAADIDSISGTTITMSSGKTIDTIFTSEDVKPEETDDEKDGTPHFTQSVKVVCDKISEELFTRYRFRKVVVKLFDSDQVGYLIGNLDYPATCSTQQKLERSILSISCESPQSLVS